MIQVGITRDIGDAEAALAENRLDLIPVQSVALIERVLVFIRVHTTDSGITDPKLKFESRILSTDSVYDREIIESN